MLLIAATAPAQVAANVALIFFRRDVFDLHDRLEQNRFALLEAIFHGENRRDFERELVRIDFVETSVNDIDLNIDHRITAKHAVEHRFLDSFLHRWNVFARNNAADDLVFDYQALAALARSHIDLDVAVLTAAARLLDQLPDAVRAGRDRFTIRDLRFAGVRIDLEFAEHAVANNFQVQLAHSGDDRLAGIFVRDKPGKSDLLQRAAAAPRPFFPGRLLSWARSPWK